MRRAFLFAVLLLSLAVPTSVRGDTIWVNCHNGTAFCTDEAQLAVAKAEWESQGASVVVSPELTADITNSDVRMVIIALPSFGFDTPQTSMYIPGFLANGGRLVLLAEKEGDEFDDANAILRDVLSGVPDHGLTLNYDSVNPGCNNTTTSIASDKLTAGLSTWHFASVNTVSGGTPLITFSRSDGGTGTLAAVSRLPNQNGEVILIGDVDGFFLFCASEAGVDFSDDHRVFYRNLYEQTGNTIVDGDNDTFGSDVDCNDDDPYVHPEADEDCDNGVDDDCDGLTDAEDDDCDETGDDDAGDDDSFGDDDTQDSFDPGGGGTRDDWGTGCCSANIIRTSAEGDSLGWSLAVLGLGGLFCRRRRRASPD